MQDSSDDQLPDSDGVQKIAAELYARDLRQQGVGTGIPNELQIPANYYQEAKVEFYRRQFREQNDAAARRAKNRVILSGSILAVVLIAAFLAAPVGNLLHKPRPFKLGFADVTANWKLLRNDGTVAHMSPTTGNGQPAVRLTVDKFTISHYGKYEGQCWAQAVTKNGPFDLRKLHQITFTARGNGLSHMRIRFNFDSEDAVSKRLNLTDQWQTYTVDLDQLATFRLNDGRFVRIRDAGVPDSIDSVEIQVGQYINPLDSHGYVEVGELDFR